MISENFQILGILNLTTDSFSDGGKFFEFEEAQKQINQLIDQGATVIDVGAQSTHPNAQKIEPDIEIERLKPVVKYLKEKKIKISIDSFEPLVQKEMIDLEIDFLNDVKAFHHPEIYPSIKTSDCRLIIMHSVHEDGIANYQSSFKGNIIDRIFHFFENRLNELSQAGICDQRFILDPGMGFFLGEDPQLSFEVLRVMNQIKQKFGLPLLVSVSRKSFLGKIVKKDVVDREFASLAAEIYALNQGVDYIRTHHPGKILDFLEISNHLKD